MSAVPKVIDRREIWLDGVSIDATKTLSKLQNRRISGITLSEKEEEACELATGYLYLLRLCKDMECLILMTHLIYLKKRPYIDRNQPFRYCI